MTINISIKEIETHISELESECNRLSHALELQKSNTTEMKLDADKKIEELTKDLRHKVNIGLG